MRTKLRAVAMNVIECPYPHPAEGNDDETISSANTEDRLLSSSSRTSSDIIISDNRVECCGFERRKHSRAKVRSCSLIFFAIALSILGVISIIWTPFWVCMNERLKMMPGLPPYEWWKNPPDEVLLRVYVFNVTNSEMFLNGTDSKLKLEQIGPIIFREKLTHGNVTFNDNGTMTYVAKRTAIFLPEMNDIDLNRTIITPNLAMLGIASYLHDASFFTKFAYNLLLRGLKSDVFVTKRIDDYLWNFSDPILDVAQTIVPSMVPVKNMGILDRIYSKFEDVVTVYVGKRHGHDKFFLIDKYDGSSNLPGYGRQCTDTLIDSTEGVAYPQFLTRNSTLFYWRKTMCRVTPLYFSEQLIKYGVIAYKFVLPGDTFDRISPSYDDCYVSFPPLPNGLSDVSNCYFDFPMAASFPHFLHGDERLRENIDGLDPSEEKHGSYVIVEPITGIPMESRARSQSNLVMRKMTGFSESVQRFSNLVVPMFWAEYNQVGLPWYISSLMYFTVAILPWFQWIMINAIFTSSVVVLVCGLRARRRPRGNRMRNQTLQFGREIFFAKT